MPDTFSAKQVASRIGTDPKTLRKFLRSEQSPYVAVGQGSRYEFPVADLAEIRDTFRKWQSRSGTKTPKPKPAPTPKPAEVKKVVEAIKTGSNRIEARPSFDDMSSDWHEFDPDGPSSDELDEIGAEDIDDLLEDLDD